MFKNINNETKLKPIIKWVGGITQILDEIFELFPKVIFRWW